MNKVKNVTDLAGFLLGKIAKPVYINLHERKRLWEKTPLSMFGLVHLQVNILNILIYTIDIFYNII
jgi:hypothetical protein